MLVPVFSEGCFNCSGEDYRGHHNITLSGHTCQRAEKRKKTIKKKQKTQHSLEENYCRNPNGNPRPWCYTSNSSKRWDYCSIPRCGKILHLNVF
uniref:Kringle domain-containing protein n=1 Tax=Kryptolebias marmoratus TaxID=37003 RepID=A0A3Q3AQ89_KRYMA